MKQLFGKIHKYYILQRGAAIITALLVVVLATLAVSSLIWRIFAVAKTVHVLTSRDQAQEIAVAGIDWARAILREDKRVSATDHLGEPWAVPLADTHLGEDLQPQTGVSPDDNDAVLSGTIEDAQGRFNLYNLLQAGDALTKAQQGFLRMCSALGVSDEQAFAIVALVQKSQTSLPMAANQGASAGSGSSGSNTNNSIQNDSAGNSNFQLPSVFPVQRWEDLRNAPGLSDDTWLTLRPYVVWLPQTTPVNANTAPAEVLYSAMQGLDLSGIQQLVASRARVSFNNVSDIASRLPGTLVAQDSSLVSVSSEFFLISGTVQVQQSRILSQALVQRDSGKVYVLWRAQL